ncbi:TetR/AcrR family transcriptional regulator [Bosea lathyri]|jgi:TetR/AcrR family transcriptional repressor of mexJK operon|uniref:Transcriptional regulator, TetR family n=1 Tax=Bosea lathyri TaxID=1036778 RepID=A0A1H5Z8E5_9HYPH|nr:TetR/AcrR family transcriptional regulator [Bosea lathyri]SEG32799.1 transcriptional regulator, TetR family [Bosea lathyri]
MTETTSSHRSTPARSDAKRLPEPGCLPAEKSRPDKHHAITRAASEMFLAEGFDRASLDQIAHRAGVSKQTIYSHFIDKEALFKAICSELTEKLTIPLRQPAAKGDLRSTLIRLGEDALAMMLHPASLDLHRLVMSAASRFPELGRAAYEAGAMRMIDDLSALLLQRSQIGDGLTQAITPARSQVLAEQFVGMLRGFHQVRGLLGVKPTPPAKRKAYVSACVDMLLRGA